MYVVLLIIHRHIPWVSEQRETFLSSTVRMATNIKNKFGSDINAHFFKPSSINNLSDNTQKPFKLSQMSFYRACGSSRHKTERASQAVTESVQDLHYDVRSAVWYLTKNFGSRHQDSWQYSRHTHTHTHMGTQRAPLHVAAGKHHLFKKCWCLSSSWVSIWLL